jgi:tight adherence protein B
MLVLVTFGVVVSTSRAQADQPGLHAVDVDTSTYPHVSMTFDVPASSGAPWRATVREGSTAHVATVQSGGLGAIEVVLALDTSGSMAGAPLAAAKSAAISFVRQLPAGTKAAVIGFGDAPYVVSPLTADAGALEASIAGLRASGETALYDALGLATTQFSLLDVPRSIILVSDGGDTASGSTLAGVTDGLVRAKARVFGLRLVTDETNDGVLAGLASATHGRTVDAVDPASLTTTYGEIAGSALRQVRLSYVSTAHGSTPVRVDLTDGAVTRSTTMSLTFPAAPISASPTTTMVAGDAPVTAATTRSLAPLVLGGAALFGGLALILFRLLTRPPRSLLAVRRAPGVASYEQLKGRAGAAFERTLERGNQRAALSARLEHAGIALRPGEYLAATCAIAGVVAFVGFAAAGPALGLLAAIVVPLGAFLVLGSRATKRRSTLEKQLPEVISQLVSSLRAGYGVMQAFSAVAAEIDAPMSDELHRVVKETQLGRELSESLAAMAERVGGQDFAWVVQAIEINREVGGDLVEVLEAVGATIRAREQLRRQIKTLSAQGRLSARILLGLPFVLAAVISVVNPGYLAPFTQAGIGPVLLVAGVVLMAVGRLWMRRIVRLEY